MSANDPSVEPSASSAARAPSGDGRRGLLARMLPAVATPESLLEGFLGFVEAIQLTLYPAQEEAILEIFDGKNVILNTPTGSGKSLVAAAMHFKSLAEGKRAFYTSPIKALVSEKFFDLCELLGAENVGMMTGDASLNRDAPIICCTAEVLANVALREGARARVDYVVMDEFHYYGDRDRGTAWQVPLLTLPQSTFLLMSATLGPMDFFVDELTRKTGRPTSLVASTTRPVPLDFEYRETPLHETIADLIARDRAPIYVVSFTQRGCAEEAQNLMSTDVCSKEDKRAINEALHGVRFTSPYGKEIQRHIKHGIGIHHAGLLPRYRLLVEKLAQKGLLKVICGTDTLGVGVNVPIRSVLFTKLCKFDGLKTAVLTVRDFQQISGRAGRKGFDNRGTVAAQAPEHVIENLRLEAKAGNDPSKKRRIVKKKPPERGYAHWDRATFDRLITSSPEPLQSRFKVSHAMLLDVVTRPPQLGEPTSQTGCHAMKQLLSDAHETDGGKRGLRRTALTQFHALVTGGVLRLVPNDDGTPRKHLALASDLQLDFSLHQALSLYLLDTVEKLSAAADGQANPTHALDILSLCESIVEDPEPILYKQIDQKKTAKMAEMKAAGVEYDERIAELEKISHDKPLAETLYATFNEFRHVHPWAADANVRPKSVARAMFETFQSFDEYIRDLELQRVEGLLLRYLSDVYKVLVQTVPPSSKTEAVEEIVAYLGTVVRNTDASLLEEWERMRSGVDAAKKALGDDPIETAFVAVDIVRDKKAFTVLVRNEVFRLVRALARKDYELALEITADGGPGDDGAVWTVDTVEAAMTPFWEAHQALRTDPASRAPVATRIEPSPAGFSWKVRQTLFDLEGDDDWVMEVEVDLERARDVGRPVLRLGRIGV